MVDDLDDGSKSAGEGVVSVDGDNAANLNEAPVGSLNHCFAHCDRCSIDSLSVAKSIYMFADISISTARRRGVIHTNSRSRVAVRKVDGFCDFSHRGVANDFLITRLLGWCAGGNSTCALSKIFGFLVFAAPHPDPLILCTDHLLRLLSELFSATSTLCYVLPHVSNILRIYSA